MTHIIVFGDSIAYGAWDEEGGWVQRLRKFLDKKVLSDKNFPNPDFFCLVYNLGVSGDTAANLIKRFELETLQRTYPGEENIIIFAIGVNDSEYENGKPIFTTQEFQKNIGRLIKLARKYASKIVFVGLMPVDDSKVDPMPWAPDKSYRLEYVKKFDQALREVCSENKIGFIEIFNVVIKMNCKDLLADGAHPNSKGHQKIYELVKDYLLQHKIITI